MDDLFVMLGIPAIVVVFLLLIFGTALIGNEQTLRCYEIVKDKSAVEMKLLCK